MLWFWESRDFGWQGGGGVRGGRGSSLELAGGGVTEGGGGTEAAGLAEVGEVVWLPAQPEKAVTPWGIIK